MMEQERNGTGRPGNRLTNRRYFKTTFALTKCTDKNESYWIRFLLPPSLSTYAHTNTAPLLATQEKCLGRAPKCWKRLHWPTNTTQDPPVSTYAHTNTEPLLATQEKCLGRAPKCWKRFHWPTNTIPDPPISTQPRHDMKSW